MTRTVTLTGSELFLAAVIYVALPIAVPLVLGWLASVRMQVVDLDRSPAAGSLASITGLTFILLWAMSGPVTLRTPWKTIDEDFFVVPFTVTVVAAIVVWVVCWLRSQRS